MEMMWTAVKKSLYKEFLGERSSAAMHSAVAAWASSDGEIVVSTAIPATDSGIDGIDAVMS